MYVHPGADLEEGLEEDPINNSNNSNSSNQFRESNMISNHLVEIGVVEGSNQEGLFKVDAIRFSTGSRFQIPTKAT